MKLFLYKQNTARLFCAAIYLLSSTAFVAEAAWAPPVQVTPTPVSFSPLAAVSIDDNSDAQAGWLDAIIFTDDELYTASLPAQSTPWNAPILLDEETPPNYATFPTLFSTGLHPAGDMSLAAWAIFNSNSNPDQIVFGTAIHPTLSTSWPAPAKSNPIDGFPQGGNGDADEFGNLALVLGVQPSLSVSGPPYSIIFDYFKQATGVWAPVIFVGTDFGTTAPTSGCSAANNQVVMAWKTVSLASVLSLSTSRFSFLTENLTSLNDVPLPLGTTDINNVQVYLAPNGNAVVVFGAQFGSGNFVLHYSTLTSGSDTWSTPIAFSDPANETFYGGSVNTALSIDGDQYGNTNFLWIERNTTTDFVRTTHLTFGVGLSPTVNLTPNTGANVVSFGTAVKVDTNSFGNALATWQLLIGGTTPTVQVASSQDGITWSSSEDLSTDGAYPNIALSDQGTGLAAWGSPYGPMPVLMFSSRNNYLFALQPPQFFTARLLKTIFATQKTYSVRLSWTASPAPHITEYRIYKDGNLVATLPPYPPFEYVEHLQTKQITSTYTLVAVASNGNESIPVTATVINK